ncbi:hypothetical protein WJX72_000378 [[Myrmecia] bisecta]|uniref:DSBA-like thioredoxin domain-containing protein n=1 Tax=[Myrmecia] bisecta TaxID=41462 RepID=A0AAW1R3Z9_9CHLO
MAATAGKATIIDVVSDTVCPWCFIGKRRLESAIKQYQGPKQFEVRWHPYQLNPHAEEEGVNKLEYYKQKFGEERTNQIIPRMEATFAAEGLQYNMDGLTGNTLDSHRLIAHAAQQGSDKQNKLVEELFKAYFTQGKYINDPAVLRAAAQNAGIEGAEEVIKDKNKYRAEVAQEMRTLGRGVNGVPHFIIDGKYSLSGAQDPSTFVEVFQRVGS